MWCVCGRGHALPRRGRGAGPSSWLSGFRDGLPGGWPPSHPRRGAPKICPRNKPKSGSEADARLERCLTDRVIRGPDSARRRHGDESLRRGSDSDAVGPCPARQRCHGAVIPVAYDVQLYIIIESSNAPPRDILTKVGYKTEYSTKTLQTFRL